MVALREMLDMDTSGEVGEQLYETYTVLASNIWKASRDKNREDLEKLLIALTELRGAWESVSANPKDHGV